MRMVTTGLVLWLMSALLAGCPQTPAAGTNVPGGTSTGEQAADDGRTTGSGVSTVGGELIRSVTFSPEGPYVLGQEVLITATVADGRAQDSLAILLGADQTAVANLNDIGWPPDETAGDSVYSGQLDWLRVPEPAAGLAVRVRYTRGLQLLEELELSPLTIQLPDVRITKAKLRPGARLTVADTLVLEARINAKGLPGKVIARVGDDPVDEVALLDDGEEPDSRARDGVWTGKYPRSLAYLPPETELKVVFKYLAADGTVVASREGPALSIERPAVYLTGFSRQPAGAIEFGEQLTFKVEFNREVPEAEAQLMLGDDHIRAAVLRARKHVDGEYVFTGEWTGELDYSLGRIQPGEDQSLRVEYSDGGVLQSVLDGEPLTIRPPEVAITGLSFKPEPPFTLGDKVLVYATTDKPVRGGRMQLLIDGEQYCSLGDDGVHHGDMDMRWRDEAAVDGVWTGRLLWYCSRNYVAPGRNLPLRVDYLVGETVYASYDAGAITINRAPVELAGFFYTPTGPIHHGDELVFTAEVKEPLNIGRMTVQFGDGIAIAYLGVHELNNGQGPGSILLRGKMIWRHDMPPGIYDNLTLRYFLNNGAIDETWDVMDYVEPLEVLPARP